MLRTLKSRLTALYVGIFAIFLIALSAYFQVSTTIREWRDFDRDLRRDAETFASLVVEELVEKAAGQHTEEDWTKEMIPFADVLRAEVAIYDEQGRVVFTSAGLKHIPPRKDLPPLGSPNRIVSREWSLTRHPGLFRADYMTIQDSRFPRYLLEFGRSSAGLTLHLQRQLIGLAIAIPVLVGLAALAGFLFVRRALRPVEQMSALAREISAGGLAQRVPLPDSEGELKQLAVTLNDMLQRLDEAFGRLRTFTADAAHELRTPIATVRGALETSIERKEPEMREAIGEALEELGRLNEIVDKLLLLARAEGGRLLEMNEPIDLSQIVRQVVEAVQAPAAARRMTLEVKDPVKVTMSGDAALMRRAIHNLVENAVKYGKEGGRILVTIDPTGVEVVDDGPGISAEHLPRVFDPFYRVDAARSDRVPGSGLGLAIVRSVVRAHRGNVEVESKPGRTSFRMRLPVVPFPFV